MASETQYKVFCTEESIYYTAWYSTMPVCCPNNYRHAIDPAKTIKINTRPTIVSLVRIQEESSLTNGNFRYESFKFDCIPNSNTVKDIKFPYPVNVLTTVATTLDIHKGDYLNVSVIPSNPIVGITVSNLTPGESNIYVSTTVLNYLSPGFQCIIGSENMGEVLKVNIDSNMITTQYAISNVYVYPSYVKMNAIITKNLDFITPMTHNVGAGKIGASYLPANTTLRAIYTNNSSNQKDFVVHLEYLY
jgi:hypothetical protein